MTAKTAKKTATPVVITAPKIASAWAKVCETSAKSESEIISAIENLSAVMVLESGLSVRDVKKVITDTNKVSSFVKVSHVSALPTWSKLRAKHADFKALPLAKQLSTAMSAYDVLGAGKGEQFKTLDALTKEVSTVRKAKAEDRKESTPSDSGKTKTKKNPLADILTYLTALDYSTLNESEQNLIAEIHATLDSKMIDA